MQSIAELIHIGFNLRAARVAMAVLGVAVYSLFCLALLQDGYLKVAPPAFHFMFGAWVLGLIALIVSDKWSSSAGRFDAGAFSLIKALWCNLGVVFTALLVPHPVRLLLLVVPLFGVLYAALHLIRTQMFVVAAVTWLAYLGGLSVLARMGSVDISFEFYVAIAFTCMLVAMVYMGSEVTALKTAFDTRREALNEAMEQLSEQAMRDELTGLFNRRYIMDVLARQKALADRGHIGFTLCYCDLDHFKKINDRYGHQVGDRVLADFADIARSVVRSVDFVARLGGEEFLLVLIGTDEEKAETVARRLCDRTKLVAFIPQAPDYRLTVSIGVASFGAGERVEDVIQRADQALYAAKSAGRDQIVLAE